MAGLDGVGCTCVMLRGGWCLRGGGLDVSGVLTWCCME